jgi:hypothetical protein
MSAIDTALGLLAMGFLPVRLRPMSKAATESAWPSIIHSAESVRREFAPADNVGALMGEPSGWVVDVDIDSIEALRHAPGLLPRTRRFGRASKPASHYLFRAPGAVNRKWTDAQDRMIVELRSTRFQTMMPGSTHPSGEAVEWVDADEPIVDIEAHELTALLDKLALRCGWARPEPAAIPQRAYAPTGEGYGATALREELARLAATGEGGRNNMLNDVAFRIAQLVDAGELEPDALEAVRATALSTGLDAREVEGTMRSAEAAAARNPRARSCGKIQSRRDGKPLVNKAILRNGREDFSDTVGGFVTPYKKGGDATNPITREKAESMGGGYVDELLADIRTTQGRKVGGIPIPGFPLLTDALFGLRGVCLLTAPSGMGKTTFVNTVALNVARGKCMDGADMHEPMRVAYVTAEMSRADVALSMASTLAAIPTRTWLTGEANGEEAPDGLLLRWDTRQRAHGALSTLRELERGKLLMLDAHGLMRAWSRGEGHALSGLEDATLQLAGGKPMLVIVDTLATLEVQSPDGRPYRSELDMDKDIVDGLKAWRNALPPGSCILAVHEESKAATGSGDGHAVRGSSRYLFSTSQRLAFTYADSDDIGTRTLGLRGDDDADPLVAEIDIRIPKARRGGDAGAVITLEHEYRKATVRERARVTEQQLRRLKRDSRRGGK